MPYTDQGDAEGPGAEREFAGVIDDESGRIQVLMGDAEEVDDPSEACFRRT